MHKTATFALPTHFINRPRRVLFSIITIVAYLFNECVGTEKIVRHMESSLYRENFKSIRPFS